MNNSGIAPECNQHVKEQSKRCRRHRDELR